MAASFPGAIKSFSAIVNGVTKLVAALFNSPYDEITAIETELGTDPAGSATDLKTRLAVGMNNDGTLNLSNGGGTEVLPAANGGTGAVRFNFGYNISILNSTATTITFATAFSNTNYSIVATLGQDATNSYAIKAYNKTTTQCTFFQTSGITQIFDYIAVGN